MPSLDLLVPALAGYLLLRLSNFSKFGLLREAGYHVAFRSALVGSGLYALGWALAQKLPVLGGLERVVGLSGSPLEISAAGVWSLFLGLLVPVVWHAVGLVEDWVKPERSGRSSRLFYSSREGARRAARKRGDFVDLLVDDANRPPLRTVELALRGGKTYIGFVVESQIGRPTGDAGGLVLVPLLSGYRRADDQRLVLTTSYSRLLRDRRKVWKHLRVAIPRADIRWARFFDYRLYSAPEGEAPLEELTSSDD